VPISSAGAIIEIKKTIFFSYFFNIFDILNNYIMLLKRLQKLYCMKITLNGLIINDPLSNNACL
jgi:hypothetical protein